MQYAIVRNGVVENIAEWDGKSDWPAPEGTQLVPSGVAGIGDTWDGKGFAKPLPPPTPVPSTISDRQFFQALAMQGTITKQEALAAVKTGELPATLVNLLSSLDPSQRFGAEMVLSGATTFHRGHPLTSSLAAGMGWTSAQLDDLWRAAASL